MNNEETINSFIKPLRSMEEVFGLIYLTTETNSVYQIEFITETFNLTFSANYTSQIIKMAISKFARLVKISDKVLDIKEKLKTQYEIISLTNDDCFKCKSKFALKVGDSNLLVFCLDGCSNKKFMTGRCSVCNISYHLDCFEMNGETFLYNNEVKYITTSSQTAFEVMLLEWLDMNIVRNTISFSGFSETYNDLHNRNKNIEIVITD